MWKPISDSMPNDYWLADTQIYFLGYIETGNMEWNQHHILQMWLVVKSSSWPFAGDDALLASISTAEKDVAKATLTSRYNLVHVKSFEVHKFTTRQVTVTTVIFTSSAFSSSTFNSSALSENNQRRTKKRKTWGRGWPDGLSNDPAEHS